MTNKTTGVLCSGVEISTFIARTWLFQEGGIIKSKRISRTDGIPMCDEGKNYERSFFQLYLMEDYYNV